MIRPDRSFDALLEDARGVSELGPLAAPGHGRRIAPFLAISVLIIVAIAFNAESPALAAVLVTVSIGMMLVAGFVPWSRMPRWTQGAFVVVSLPLIDAMMRSTGGPSSPFLLVMLLPLVWLALYESRGWLHAGLALTAGLLALEMVPLPTTTDVLRLVVLLAGILALAPNMNRLVYQHRWALAKGDEQSRELRHLALHDTLTGLPNRALIMDRLEQLLARVRRQAGQAAALFIDLDGFKGVNDEYGHDAGDRLLQAVASRLTGTLREVDTFGRLGGDEFVVVLDSSTRPSAPELVAQRILDVFSQPFEIADGAPPVTVTASVGVAVSANSAAGELLRCADVALYQAKHAGRNCFVLFRPEMQTKPPTAAELASQLQAAVTQHQFYLAYQPIYDLGHLNMVGVEALTRWHHPTRGDLLPGEFIPALERSGQILEVGRWVLRQACAQLADWHRAGHELTVSVNISACQLDHDSVIEDVRDALRISGLPPSALILEVTETAILGDFDAVSSRLRELKTLGVRIALDHFGTGYSSLAYLQHFPIDTLKIDRSFIEAIGHSRDADAIIRMLVQLGKDLGLTTVAEGVESTKQLEHVRKHGITDVQGFLLSRPLDPATFQDHFLRTGAAISDAIVP